VHVKIITVNELNGEGISELAIIIAFVGVCFVYMRAF
jgi:hypothetical protein